MKHHCDVLIIGAGIAGAALACALKNSDLSVTILEKNPLALDTARGDHLKPSSCEIFNRWGILDDFFSTGGEKRTHTNWRTSDGEKFFVCDYSALDIPQPYFAYLNHEKIGELLLDSAAQYPNTTVIKPCPSWSVEQHNQSKIKVKASNSVGDALEITTKILVGADGRSSKVRQLFDYDTHITKYQRALVVLFGATRDPKLCRDLNIHICGDRIVTLIPRNGGQCKVAIPENRAEIKKWKNASSDELTQQLKNMLPNVEFEHLRFVDFYPPIDLRTDLWVKQNVVLIGDSCHAMHPARSQGMNMAIKCVDQLATTLMHAKSSQLNQALLDYQENSKSEVDKILDDNHQYGAMMDAQNNRILTNLKERLTQVGADKTAADARLMATAGY